MNIWWLLLSTYLTDLIMGKEEKMEIGTGKI